MFTIESATKEMELLEKEIDSTKKLLAALHKSHETLLDVIAVLKLKKNLELKN